MTMAEPRDSDRHDVVGQTNREKTEPAPGSVEWINKGDELRPNYRSRLVAKELRALSPFTPQEDLHAATPPTAAQNLLLSMLCTRLSRRGKRFKLCFLDVRRAFFYADATEEVLATAYTMPDSTELITYKAVAEWINNQVHGASAARGFSAGRIQNDGVSAVPTAGSKHVIVSKVTPSIGGATLRKENFLCDSIRAVKQLPTVRAQLPGSLVTAGNWYYEVKILRLHEKQLDPAFEQKQKRQEKKMEK